MLDCAEADDVGEEDGAALDFGEADELADGVAEGSNS